MTNPRLAADPYNLIITGVGGQGNVLASKIVGNILVEIGFQGPSVRRSAPPNGVAR